MGTTTRYGEYCDNFCRRSTSFDARLMTWPAETRLRASSRSFSDLWKTIADAAARQRMPDRHAAKKKLWCRKALNSAHRMKPRPYRYAAVPSACAPAPSVVSSRPRNCVCATMKLHFTTSQGIVTRKFHPKAPQNARTSDGLPAASVASHALASFEYNSVVESCGSSSNTWSARKLSPCRRIGNAHVKKSCERNPAFFRAFGMPAGTGTVGWAPEFDILPRRRCVGVKSQAQVNKR